jgi:magnesium chelatase family protein
MSLAVLYSRSLSGMEAPLVTVEVHIANGLPSFTIVGLPDTEVKESKDRVRAALQNAKFKIPAQRITINLAPADLPKESGRFDLPIALGILAATGQIPADKLDQYEWAGELALTGELRPICGALAMTYGASRSGRAFILPQQNAAEAALVKEVQFIRHNHYYRYVPILPDANHSCVISKRRTATQKQPFQATPIGAR